ncbi:thioredoxin domain-containing protein [Candidatus Saccharibacteria bacterium]|nr:thioredoxin domain-containing protein [Candidatus Saccharibacteria bacterium]MCL1962861.1 thioredoxin domain-containing protein [Candidatus Saccharibacteria bacterium]
MDQTPNFSQTTPPAQNQNNNDKKILIIASIIVGVLFLIFITLLIIVLVTRSSKAPDKDDATNTTIHKPSDPPDCKGDFEDCDNEPDDETTLSPWNLITKSDVKQNEIPDHYVGNPDTKIVVIEYGDFACSHCNQFSADAEKIHKDYGDRVLFIYRNFNLGYPGSDLSQRAAEAAYLVGGEDAYWEMSKLLWSTNDWTGSIEYEDARSLLLTYSKKIGLDMVEFNDAIENYKTNGIQNKITRDKDLGIESGVSGTPAWFIDGEQVNRVFTTNIRDMLDKALN